jgi:hypothetical protein
MTKIVAALAGSLLAVVAAIGGVAAVNGSPTSYDKNSFAQYADN